MELLIRAYLELIRFEIYLWRNDFAGLRKQVVRTEVVDGNLSSCQIDSICHSVDIACVWYWKRVLCLQRAAAATCLLRKCGASAELVIGAQQMPFKSHAWVEIHGQVVNDRQYLPEIYAVLDRC